MTLPAVTANDAPARAISLPRGRIRIAGLTLTAMLLGACNSGADAPERAGNASGLAPVSAATIDATEIYSGGELATIKDSGVNAFGRPAPGLGFVSKGLFENGNHLFRTPRGRERGTGPLLNAQSCQGCHVLDGKGNPPRSSEHPLAPEADLVSMLMKLARASDGQPDPVYGDQLQTRSMYGAAEDPDGRARLGGSLNGGPALGEAMVRVIYEPVSATYPDGTPYELLRPVYRVSKLSYGAMAPDIRLSPRSAPAVSGNGLLGAIDAQAIRAGADPDDTDRDGISGRFNVVQDPVTGEPQLGRFGLKAATASVLAQSAVAYRGDMGMTNRFAPEESCTPGQSACLVAAASEQTSGPGADIVDLDLAQVEFYARTLAVPQRRGWDAANRRWEADIGLGREKFLTIGCATCHTPRWQTGTATGSALGDASLLTSLTQPAPPLAALSDQIIWPFTDLLLHDMGGNCSISRRTETGASCSDDDAGCMIEQRCTGLADGVKEHQATGTEWRTAPLWGAGLVQKVNPAAGFLHDGRARTLEEAVLWHGDSPASEAWAVTERFRNLPASERAALLSYLSSM